MTGCGSSTPLNTPMRELSAPAPAKINLVLDVLGRRDDGYHDLRTVLQTLELSDRVTVWTGREPGVSVSGPFAGGAPADTSNLVWRAAAALAKHCGVEHVDLRIHIEKRIPAAAGLGGGASDAATVLRLLQQAWPGTTDEQLFEAANAVGSDEAFFLLGGTVLAEGRGERVATLAPLPKHDVVLFVPRTTIEAKTAALFRAIAQERYDTGERSEVFLNRHPQSVRTADLSNAFERVAFDIFDGLRALKEAIEERIEEPVRLAGAGPTLFWIGPPGGGDTIRKQAQGLDCEIIATRTARTLWGR